MIIVSITGITQVMAEKTTQARIVDLYAEDFTMLVTEGRYLNHYLDFQHHQRNISKA